MKKFLLFALITAASTTLVHAQSTPLTEKTIQRASIDQIPAPTFSKSEQEKIKKILGSDYVPVFSSKGELAIATSSSISKVKAVPGGGFTKVPGSQFSNILIHKGWVLATSLEMFESMKSKLGAERFKQLDGLMKSKPNSLR